MNDGYEARRRGRWLRGVGIVAAIAVLGAGAYLLGQATGEPSRSVAVSVPGPPTTMPSPTAAPSPRAIAPAVATGRDPVAVATAWLRAYRTVRFDDPTPTAWIDHVRPVVTDTLAASYERYRDGSVGADWAQFVSDQCVTDLEDDLNGVIPDEAPHTASTVNVQVAGVLRTRCAVATNSGVGANGPVSATVTLKKTRAGLWRVDKRLY